MKKTAVCIIPASSSAMKGTNYFEIYKDVLKQYKLLRMIVLFPLDCSMVFIKASQAYNRRKTKVSPFPIKSPHAGLDGFEEVLKECLPQIVLDNPDEVVVVTSGGTTKMGHMVKLVGHITSQFGWEVSYLWVAKAPNSAKYEVTYLPEVEVKYSDKFSASLVGEADGAPRLIIERDEQYVKIHERGC